MTDAEDSVDLLDLLFELIGHAASQEAFADRIEMHRTYYSAIERGENNLTLRTLRRICAGLGTKMWEVLRDADL